MKASSIDGSITFVHRRVDVRPASYQGSYRIYMPMKAGDNKGCDVMISSLGDVRAGRSERQDDFFLPPARSPE